MFEGRTHAGLSSKGSGWILPPAWRWISSKVACFGAVVAVPIFPKTQSFEFRLPPLFPIFFVPTLFSSAECFPSLPASPLPKCLFTSSSSSFLPSACQKLLFPLFSLSLALPLPLLPHPSGCRTNPLGIFPDPVKGTKSFSFSPTNSKVPA